MNYTVQVTFSSMQLIKLLPSIWGRGNKLLLAGNFPYSSWFSFLNQSFPCKAPKNLFPLFLLPSGNLPLRTCNAPISTLQFNNLFLGPRAPTDLMKNLDCNQIKFFINLEMIGKEDKNQNIYIYIYIYILKLKKKFCNLVKLLSTTMVFKPKFYFILALCPCDARLN